MTTRAAIGDGATHGKEGASTPLAILMAATDLFAERGPEMTSVRDVANHAGVNHGLVHRHFGNKRDLVAAVLNFLAERYSALLVSDGPAADIDALTDLRLRVIARTALDGYPIGDLQDSFPNVHRIAERHGVSPEALSGRQGRLSMANALSCYLSWSLFEPFLRAAADLDDVGHEELQTSIDREIERILKHSSSGTEV